MDETINPGRKVSDTILRCREVEHTTGLSRTTIWRERMAGRFPHPVQITATLHGWRASDVNAWLERRPAGRPNATSTSEDARARNK